MHNNKTLHHYIKYLLLLGTTVPHSSQEQRIRPNNHCQNTQVFLNKGQISAYFWTTF